MTDPQPLYELFDSIDAPPQAVRLPDDIGPVLAWAKTRRPLEVAGEKGATDSCPLVAYLERGEGTAARVDYESYRVNGVDLPMPDWAQEVARAVDHARTVDDYVRFGAFVRILEAVAGQS